MQSEQIASRERECTKKRDSGDASWELQWIQRRLFSENTETRWRYSISSRSQGLRITSVFLLRRFTTQSPVHDRLRKGVFAPADIFTQQGVWRYGAAFTVRRGERDYFCLVGLCQWGGWGVGYPPGRVRISSPSDGTSVQVRESARRQYSEQTGGIKKGGSLFELVWACSLLVPAPAPEPVSGRKRRPPVPSSQTAAF